MHHGDVHHLNYIAYCSWNTMRFNAIVSDFEQPTHTYTSSLPSLNRSTDQCGRYLDLVEVHAHISRYVRSMAVSMIIAHLECASTRTDLFAIDVRRPCSRSTFPATMKALTYRQGKTLLPSLHQLPLRRKLRRTRCVRACRVKMHFIGSQSCGPPPFAT